MSDTVIKVDGVSKKYCRTIKHTMLYGATDLTRSFLGLNQHTEKLRKGEFWAVNDVSFELKKGETLGIIGPNGSGKSTMLKMLNGIFMPDSGRIDVKGRVGALIEIGAGFHPMLTGRENIYINGTILGMSKKEIDRKFDEIVDFADIGDFIDSPVKHYSSGMYVRLGFAVAVHCEPAILLVDEVLAVGDMAFKNKCFKKIEQIRRNISTILVSHNLNIINLLCSHVILLQDGQVTYYGNDSSDAIAQYNRSVSPHMEQSSTIIHQAGAERNIWFSNVTMLDRDGNSQDSVVCGQPLRFLIEFEARRFLKKPFFHFMLQAAEDNVFVAFMHQPPGEEHPSFDVGKHRVELCVDSFNLQPGNYIMRVTVNADTYLGKYGRADNLITIRVAPHKDQWIKNNTAGYIEVKCTWKTELVEAK